MSYADLKEKFPASIVARDDSSNMGKLWNLFASGLDELTGVLADIKNTVSIDDSAGAQLDNIGIYLNESRGGRNDSDYQSALRVAVAKMTSIGSIPVLIDVANFILGDSEFLRVNELYANPSERLADGSWVADGLNLADGLPEYGNSGAVELIASWFQYPGFSSGFSSGFSGIDAANRAKATNLALLNRELSKIRGAGIRARAILETV